MPDKFILLATPRTGSRALESAFKGIKTKEHHVHPEDIQEECTKMAPGSEKLPKYTVCRNPYQHVLSWYWHADVRHHGNPSVDGLLKFIKERKISWYFSSRLNPYDGVADRVLRYDQDGLAVARSISRETGAKMAKRKLPRIGQRAGLDDSLLNNKEILKAIEERFPEDINLYEEVCSKWCNDS